MVQSCDDKDEELTNAMVRMILIKWRVLGKD